MAINMRNREAERLARQLAEVTGDSSTGAIARWTLDCGSSDHGRLLHDDQGLPA